MQYSLSVLRYYVVIIVRQCMTTTRLLKALWPDCICQDVPDKPSDLDNRQYKGQGQKLLCKSAELITGYCKSGFIVLYSLIFANELRHLFKLSGNVLTQ